MSDHQCPRCRAPLTVSRAPDVVLNACSRCGGVWLDPASVEAAAGGLTPKTIEMLMSIAGNASSEPDTSSAAVCSTCGASLARANVNGVAVLRCSEHGTFFDRGMLVRASATGTAGGGSAAPTPETPAGFAAPPPLMAEQIALAGQVRNTPARTSGMAVAALVFAFLCPLIGLPIAIKAMRDIEMSGGRLKGHGLSTAAMAISVINMALGVLLKFRSCG